MSSYRLAALYQRDHSGESWLTKQYLGYHYDLFPGTRHDLLRPLNDADWAGYAEAIRGAIMDGQTLILTGEDVGIHPGSGLSPYAHHDGGQMAALATALTGATWSSITRDSDTIAANLGQGRLILCRESIDAAGNTNPELGRWQKDWREEVEAKFAQPVPAPGLKKLLAWWVGAEPIISSFRTVSWFGGNHRELRLKLELAQPLGATFTFLLPPTGTVQEIALNLSAKGEGAIRFDVGCDGQEDGSLAIATSTATDTGELTRPWSAAANRYLDWAAAHRSGPGRDGSGWRLVPVRVTATGKAELMFSQPKVVVQ